MISRVVILLTILLTSLGCGSNAYYVKGLRVDTTLHVRPIGPGIAFEPSDGSYYFLFRGEYVTSIDHFRKARRSQPRERLLFLETKPNRLLDRTVKDDELFRGPYGTIYAEKTCFYNRPVESNQNTISAVASLNELEHETPVLLSAEPQDLPPLTAMSLVRILQAAPQFVIASGDYGQDGRLSLLRVDQSKNGNWISGEGLTRLAAKHARMAANYGIPEQIKIQRSLKVKHLVLDSVAIPEEISVVVFFFGYGKIIRCDELRRGVVISSRILQPSITEEERSLNPVCESRFRQQAAGEVLRAQ